MVFVNQRQRRFHRRVLSNLTILFVVLAGVIQGERLGRSAIAAVAIVIAGASCIPLTKTSPLPVRRGNHGRFLPRLGVQAMHRRPVG